MRILIVFNLAEHLKKGIASDLICEQEIKIIVPLISDLLRSRGHEVETLQADYDIWETLKRRRRSTDLVLNLAEAFGGGNDNEVVIPVMLEALGIPFTGASSHNMHFTTDKEKTKLVLGAHGIPVTPYQLFRSVDDALQSHLDYPLIVKPVREEASIGINTDSVVTSEGALRRKVRDTLERYQQPALVEAFIEGREISVGIIGNVPHLSIFPPLEFLFANARSSVHAFRSYEYKWGGQREQMIKANLPSKTMDELFEYTRIAYTVSDCQDYARMDYRIARSGRPFLLEVNYNPGIGPNTHGLNNTLTKMATFAGLSFEDLIERIVRTAADRYGITDNRKDESI